MGVMERKLKHKKVEFFVDPLRTKLQDKVLIILKMENEFSVSFSSNNGNLVSNCLVFLNI